MLILLSHMNVTKSISRVKETTVNEATQQINFDNYFKFYYQTTKFLNIDVLKIKMYV